MKIPETLQIAGITYSIQPVSKYSEELNGRLWGLHDYENTTIYIREDLEGDVFDQVFCHELVHAIMTGTGYDERNEDEHFIEVFSQLLLQVIKQL